WRELEPLLASPLKAVRIETARLLLAGVRDLNTADRTRLQPVIDEYLASLRLNADRPESQAALAMAQLQLGAFDAAEAALQEALAINDQYVPAMLNLADLYRGTGRDRDGGELFARAIALAPESAEVLKAGGLWMVRQRRTEEALELFARALAVEPDNPDNGYLLAVALNSAGRADEALQVLDAALDRSPGQRQLLEVAASIARDNGDVERLARYLPQLRN
ncbi:MAG: tetratricopeptide repeat protein, partial [Pseudomonadales bacterium]|nr:tetratricopeptide repeat protein [Pseudomonadales bacterium]